MANYCYRCGCKVNNEWKFCPVCGAELPSLSDLISNNQISDKPDNGLNTTTTCNQINMNDSNKSDENNMEIKEKQPILQRNVDKYYFEQNLIEYRTQCARENSLPAYTIFDNKALNTLVEARNNILVQEDIVNVKYWSEVRVNKHGKAIIDILNKLDRNYMP